MAEKQPKPKKPDPYKPSYLPEDEHLDPFPEEPTEERIEGMMSKWEKNYQAQIEQLTPDEKILTKEQERDLAQKIQAGVEASKRVGSARLSEADKVKLAEIIDTGKDARDTLVTANLRLAAWFVRQTMDFNREARLKSGRKKLGGAIFSDLAGFRGDKLDYSERMQIATLGLITAADKYTGEGAFSTFAMYHMESIFYREYMGADSQAPLNIPLDKAEDLKKYRQELSNLSDSGKMPDIEEIAAKLDWSIEKVVYISDLDNASQNISLEVVQELLEDDMAEQAQDTPEEDLPQSIADILTDQGVDQTVFDEVAMEDLAYRLDEAIATLPEREQVVIELRFGLNGGEPMTFEDIGKLFGITRERIRQIEYKALVKLQHPRRTARFSDYADTEDPTMSHRTELSTTEAQDTKLRIKTPSKSSSNQRKRFFGSKRGGDYVYRPRPTYTLQELKEIQERQGNE